MSNKKVPQYFLGGFQEMLPGLVGAGASFIPGIGPAIAPVAAGLTKKAVGAGSNQPKRSTPYASANTGFANGGIFPIGQDALGFAGPSHEGGGIQIPGAEVEGDETMDFIEFANGGKLKDKRDGSAYIFSKRLKVPGTNTSFADYHKKLVKANGNEDAIKQLALVQEQVSGRKDGTGATVPKIPKVQTEQPEAESGGEIEYDSGGKYYAIKASETSDDEPKYPINSADDVRDAWKLRNHGDYNISKEKLEQRIKRKAREYDVDLNTDSDKAHGGIPDEIAGQYGLNLMVDKKQTGGTTDPPSGYGSDFDWLGNDIREFFGFNTNPNAQIGSGDRQGKSPVKGGPVPSYLKRKPSTERSNFPALTGDPQTMNPQPGPWRREQDPLGINRLGAPSVDRPAQGASQDTIVPDDVDTSKPGGQTESGPIFDIEPTTIGVNRNIGNPQATEGTPEGTLETQDNNLSEQTTPTPDVDQKGLGMNALQFVPEAMNFLTGAFGRDNTPEPTRVSDRSVADFPTTVDVNPQLARNRDAYRQIINDPNATPNQKMAAQAQKMAADSAIFSEKVNRENQLKTNRSRLQASLDRANAQFANQARDQSMRARANLGPTGNIARGALASGAQKILMNQAMKNQANQDKIGAMAIISQLDPALQEKFVKQLGILDG